MPITHTNRQGDVYYLHQGQTRTGKPRYHFSKKSKGTLAEAIPEGYEVYEDPRAQVFLRRIVPRNVLPEEVALVEAGIRRHAGLNVFHIDVTPDTIDVYLPDQSREDVQRMFEELGGFRLSETKIEERQRKGSFSPALRFVLRDRQAGRFSVQRWCFRGSIDNWTWDLASGSLETLVAEYAPHLGKESFFELM
jgi:hypothetical protein